MEFLKIKDISQIKKLLKLLKEKEISEFYFQNKTSKFRAVFNPESNVLIKSQEDSPENITNINQSKPEEKNQKAKIIFKNKSLQKKRETLKKLSISNHSMLGILFQ